MPSGYDTEFPSTLTPSVGIHAYVYFSFHVVSLDIPLSQPRRYAFMSCARVLASCSLTRARKEYLSTGSARCSHGYLLLAAPVATVMRTHHTGTCCRTKNCWRAHGWYQQVQARGLALSGTACASLGVTGVMATHRLIIKHQPSISTSSFFIRVHHGVLLWICAVRRCHRRRSAPNPAAIIVPQASTAGPS
jgi:hypothetical protein